EPVDNTGTYKLLVAPEAPLVVLGENLAHVSSPDDMFLEAIADDGSVRWHKAGTAKWVRAVTGTQDRIFIASEFSGKLDFEGTRAHAAHSAALVAKLSAAGALAWARVLDTPSFTRMSGVAATPDGGVAAALGVF